MNQDRFNRPTLRTIAELTGLSTATVSRALNDISGINDATRQRVKEIARQIGYSPNLAGMQLKKGRTNSLAVSLDSGLELHHGTAQFIRGAAQAASRRNFRCISTTIDHSCGGLRVLENLISERLIDGVILNALRPEDERVKMLDEANIPFVTHGRTDADTSTSYDFDNRDFARQAVLALAERKSGPILLIAPPRAQSYGQHIVEGAGAGAAEAAIELLCPDDLSSDDYANDIKRRVSDMLARRTDISGIISCSTTAGLAAVSAMHARQCSLGRDIDVVSKDCSLFLKALYPEIITCQEDFEQAGIFLADAIIDQIDDRDAPVLHRIEPFQGFL